MTAALTSEKRIQAFVKLGQYLQNLSSDEVGYLARRASNANTWFDEQNVQRALAGLAQMLEEERLREWLFAYDLNTASPKKVGVVMAGNIPMVGFHDMMCVLLAGHDLLAKTSSDDPFLLRHLAEKLIEAEPAFAAHITFADMLKDADAIIATGSDNTARYFEYYFGRKPHIIRKNRSSIGILSGHEDEETLGLLGNDIFQYYGLGCRNVSKLFVPQGYDFTEFFEAIEIFKTVQEHHKYHNNYDYNKSILLVNRIPHLDNGFLLLTESKELVSPISVLFYETYAGQQELQEKLAEAAPKTQCLVSDSGWFSGSFPFGQAQCPMPWDYADNVDTMKFLLHL